MIILARWKYARRRDDKTTRRNTRLRGDWVTDRSKRGNQFDYKERIQPTLPPVSATNTPQILMNGIQMAKENCILIGRLYLACKSGTCSLESWWP